MDYNTMSIGALKNQITKLESKIANSRNANERQLTRDEINKIEKIIAARTNSKKPKKVNPVKDAKVVQDHRETAKRSKSGWGISSGGLKIHI